MLVQLHSRSFRDPASWAGGVSIRYALSLYSKGKMQRLFHSIRSGSGRIAARRLLSTAAADELPAAAGSAGRYSQALYNAAQKVKALDAVTADVNRMQTLREESADFNEFLLNPTLPRDAKREALAEVMDRESFSQTFKQFMYVMADNGRTPETAKILAAFQDIIASVKGEVVCKVTSAVPIGEWEQAALKKAIKQRFFDGKAADITVETAIDPELLGGITVQVGDRFMDLSTRTELRKVQEEILKAVA